ncbi:uncharacterized protein LOC122672435 [Telopea speciosissima]|uniref:uncharacterized protein LOC122672435 n=1 Tax=Telopea speciosissima TaxID=54955 RepID=UPI001CC7AE49|nr:uncharacterized protein LOC122672435 [Telopea speciosissima]
MFQKVWPNKNSIIDLYTWWKDKAESIALSNVWLAGFILVPFHIWQEQNLRHFEGQGNLSSTVMRLIKFDLRDASSFMHCKIRSFQDLRIAREIGVSFPNAQSNHIIEILWRKPENIWTKLNIDGCSLGNRGHSSAAGIFRNYQGHPTGSFSHYLGISTNFLAEFSAFFIGVQMARGKKIQFLWIECDVEVVVTSIKNGNTLWKFKQNWFGVVSDLQAITWKITHSYREVNTIADLLAKRIAFTQVSHFWVESPIFVHHEIEWDLQERSRFRFVHS